MKRPLRALAVAVAMALPAAPAAASGVPVVDASSLAQTILLVQGQARQMGIDSAQLENLITTLQTAQQHLALAEDHYTAVTGARAHIAALFEGDVSEARIALTLSALNKVADLGKDVTERVARIDETFEFVSGAERYGDTDDSAREAVFDLKQQSVKTALVVNESVFEDAATGFARYDGYRQQIASGTPDLKASIDLNTRVQIENGEMLARVLQALAASGQMQAVEKAAQIRALSRNAAMMK